MKKSELRKIIKEEIRSVLNENKIFTPTKGGGYKIEFNGKTFKFKYQEYDDAYIATDIWDDKMAKLNQFLNKKGVKTQVDVAPEKTIIIDKEEIKK